MKLMFIVITLSFLSLMGFKESPSNFDYELSTIVRNFKEGIMDEEECGKLKREAEDLVDEIEDALEDKDEYTNTEIVALEKLKREAKAMEEFIGAVGRCGNYSPSIEEFNLANQRVKAIVSYVSKDKFCVDVIKVEIDDYVVYLAKNNSDKNYTVTYKWQAPDRMNFGNGDFGLSANSVRHFYDNRDNVKLKNISVLGISCTEF